MKIHYPVACNVVSCLEQVFVHGFYADKVLERAFKANTNWGARDRRFVAESVYEIVRWARKLLYAVDPENSYFAAHVTNEKSSSAKLEENSTWNSEIGWPLFAGYLLSQGIDLPPHMIAPGRELEAFASPKRLSEIRLRLSDAEMAKIPRAVRESIPDWMDQLGSSELPTSWDAHLGALNKTAPAILRANTLKISRENLLLQLRSEGLVVTAVPDMPDAIELLERKNVFRLPSFQSGLFEMQDTASQRVAMLLNPQPGDKVIDACAGAGGKSLHMAALLKNKGKIISMDIFDRKLVELKRRAARAGVDVIETRVIESSKTIKRLDASADKLLLDVPCSGLGVLRRNPDTKWKLQPSDLQRLQNTQAEILREYSRMLKPTGSMVYATCSFLPSENQDQVARFLNENPAWKLVTEHRTAPGSENQDGFYAALLQKKI